MTKARKASVSIATVGCILMAAGLLSFGATVASESTSLIRLGFCLGCLLVFASTMLWDAG